MKNQENNSNNNKKKTSNILKNELERGISKEKINSMSDNSTILVSSQKTKGYRNKNNELAKEENPHCENNFLFTNKEEISSLNEAHFLNYNDNENQDSLSITNGLSEFEISKIKDKNVKTKNFSEKNIETTQEFKNKMFELETINTKVIKN